MNAILYLLIPSSLHYLEEDTTTRGERSPVPHSPGKWVFAPKIHTATTSRKTSPQRPGAPDLGKLASGWSAGARTPDWDLRHVWPKPWYPGRTSDSRSTWDCWNWEVNIGQAGEGSLEGRPAVQGPLPTCLLLQLHGAGTVWVAESGWTHHKTLGSLWTSHSTDPV